MKSHEDKKKKQLNNLLGAKNDRLARFGPYMPNLLQHIEEKFKRGEFHQKPRGPLGKSHLITLTYVARGRATNPFT